MRIGLIAAITSNYGIGLDGKLPWHPTSLTKDMIFFNQVTSGKSEAIKNLLKISAKDEQRTAVVMGRRTWESIPKKKRPLSNRLNIVISKTIESLDSFNNTRVFGSYEEAEKWCLDTTDITDLFIIGGALLYKEILQSGRWDYLFLTFIDDSNYPLKCDTYFPLEFVDVKSAANITPLLYPEKAFVADGESKLSYKFCFMKNNNRKMGS